MYAIYSLAKRIHTAEMQPAQCSAEQRERTRETCFPRNTTQAQKPPCMTRSSKAAERTKHEMMRVTGRQHHSPSSRGKKQTKQSPLQSSDHLLLYGQVPQHQKELIDKKTCEGIRVTIPCFLQTIHATCKTDWNSTVDHCLGDDASENR